MSEQDKAQKLAAAKKRVEQMKKKKGIIKKETGLEATTRSIPSTEVVPTFPPPSPTPHTSRESTEDTNSIITDNIIQNTLKNFDEQRVLICPETELKTTLTQEELVSGIPPPTNHDPSTVSKSAEVVSKDLASLPIEYGEDEKQLSNTDDLKSTQQPKLSDSAEGKESTVTKIHNERCAQLEALQNGNDNAEKEYLDLRRRLVQVEAENNELRLELKRLQSIHAQSDEHHISDQLNNEKYARFMKKIQELEQENLDLRRGIWTEAKGIPKYEEFSAVASPDAKFTEVDLGAHSSPRQDISHSSRGGLGKLIANSLNAITGTGNDPGENKVMQKDKDEDELLDFDEDAFMLAKEEESKNRIERIKNIKRSLKNWEGWRLDLVDIRCQIKDGVGPIFDI